MKKLTREISWSDVDEDGDWIHLPCLTGTNASSKLRHLHDGNEVDPFQSAISLCGSSGSIIDFVGCEVDSVDGRMTRHICGKCVNIHNESLIDPAYWHRQFGRNMSTSCNICSVVVSEAVGTPVIILIGDDFARVHYDCIETINTHDSEETCCEDCGWEGPWGFIKHENGYLMPCPKCSADISL